MHSHSVVCFSSFLILLLYGGTGFCEAERAHRGGRRATAALRPVSKLKVDRFTTFRQKMAKVMGVRENDLAKKEIEDWYNKEIVATGKKIDFDSSAQTASITVFLLSALCDACEVADCVCVQQFCNKACP